MFFGRVRADSGDRSPFGSFWFQPVGFATGSGVRVSGDGALALTAVWACVRNGSEDFAKLPFCMYKPRVGGGRDLVPDHWLVRLFAKAPNNWQTPFEWREMLQAHLMLRGNAFCRIVEDGRGGIAQLIPMHPDRVKMELLANGEFRYRFAQLDGSEIILMRSEVWHIRGLGADGYMGYNPIQIQRQMLGVGLSRQEYAARFFQNDAKPTGGWIETTGKFPDQATKDVFRDSWRKAQGGKNGGRVAVLEPGMKYHEVGFNNKDSQFVEASGMSVTECARMFRMPPHKIADLARSTNNNIEQQNIEYGTDFMGSWCSRWESSILNALLGEDTEFEVDFDLRELMRGDMAARGTYINTRIFNGSLTRNEARGMEGENPLEGLDMPLQPVNMAPVDDDGMIMLPPAPPAEEGGPGTEPKSEPDARFRSLIEANALRMAKRIVASQMPSAPILAEALAITQQEASVWLGCLITAPSLEEGFLTSSLIELALKGRA